jgi:hypothetical protein
MRGELREIAHEDQRYPTVGDWDISGRQKPYFLITASRMAEPDYTFLIQLHELIEAWLCYRRGIREVDVTDFDLMYESNRPEGDVSEPGDSTKAPYHREHVFATMMERQMAAELGVNWDQYSRAVEEM